MHKGDFTTLSLRLKHKLNKKPPTPQSDILYQSMVLFWEITTVWLHVYRFIVL